MSFKHALSVRSDFSIGESLLQIKKLIEKAKELGYESVALVDYMSVSAMVEFTNQAKKAGIKPIIGATVRVYDDPTYRKPKKGSGEEEKSNHFFNLKVYVQNEEGMHSLLRLLSRGHSEDYFYYHARVGIDEVLALKGCVMSTGDFYGLFHHPRSEEILATIAGAGNKILCEVVPIDSPLYARLNAQAIAAAKAQGLEVMATYPALYLDGQDDSADVLRAISINAKMTDRWLPRPAIRDFALQEPVRLLNRIVEHRNKFGFKWAGAEILEWMSNARRAIVESNTYEFKKLPPCLPAMAPDEYAALVEECRKGFEQRLTLLPVFGHKPDRSELPKYVDRLKFELATIKKMNFSGYFLLVQSIVRWAKENGIAVGPGRGSVGGSLVAYLMGITDVDPIRFDLLFERFINPDRVDLPDADLDFMSYRRHEVIENLIGRFGADKVAGISNYATLGASGAIRDVGRVHEVDPFELSCSKLVPDTHGVSVDLATAAEQVPEIAKFKAGHPVVWKHASNLEGAMRGLSQHAAGVVVAGEPLINRAVVETRSGGNVVNWDKKYVEDWGLIKMDILGLTTLDILALAASFIEDRHKRKVDYLRLNLDDEKVLAAFAKGDTAGVFQFESSGMRNLIKELAVGGKITFDDLVAVVALFRPGPLDAGLCDDYVCVKQGTKPLRYDHPNMEAALKSTHGVIVYQEQVMQVCRDVAGFTITEADHVRKAMGKKDKEKMKEWSDRFIAGAQAKSGMDPMMARQLWDKIEVFAGYAFNKSHSVEYVLISWMTMWVKVYYPAEFYAASMTIADKEEKLAALALDAKAKGIQILPPDINISGDHIVIKDDNTLYAPFQAVKGISENSAKAIMQLRAELGRPFANLKDFETQLSDRKIAKVCNSRSRDALMRVGAFHSTDGGLPPLHPDRLKDRLELMPGFTVEAVKADRKLTQERIAVLEIARLSSSYPACDKCSLKGRAHPLPQMGKTAKFMAVFDCPNFEDERAGKMLSGDVGNIVKLAIKNAGMTVNDGYYTSLVKSPKEGKMLTNDQINGCTDHLRREIEILKPPVVIALGVNAIRFFAPGIKGNASELVGKVIYDAKIDASIVLGMNPAQVLFDNSKVKLIEEAFGRVAELIA